MPPGSWAAAVAECDDEQYWQSFSADTYAAISSRSPRVRVLGPRSSTSANSLSGRPVSGRYRSSPRIPGSAEFNVMCGMPSPYAGNKPLAAGREVLVPRRQRLVTTWCSMRVTPSDGDDDLAAGAAFLEVTDGRRGLAERVGPVDGGHDFS